jgi:pyrimidine operon attenuation protein/uracil phosphoribosyltransferase
MARKYILDADAVKSKLQRMALEIIENNLEEESLILVGIRDKGSVIARNIERILKQLHGFSIEFIELTIDKKNPGRVAITKQSGFDGRVIILIDDVASSGRTMLYALKPFLEFHPRKILTLALVERTHKLFPINLDYTGLSVATTLQEHIYVEVSGEAITGAYLE